MRRVTFVKSAIDGMHFTPNTFERKIGCTIEVKTTNGHAWAEFVGAELLNHREAVITLDLPDDAGDLLAHQPWIPGAHVDDH